MKTTRMSDSIRRIYLVPHTHADVGYTDFVPEVERTWCRTMDQAIRACRAGMKWTIEQAVIVDAYRRARPPEKVAELAQMIREGKIELAGLYDNLEAENTGHEELVRSVFYANSELRRTLGIEARVAMLSDMTGVTWGLPQILSRSGIQYLLFAPGEYKGLMEFTTLPHLFYWCAPDGSRVLTLLRGGQFSSYTGGNAFLNLDTMEERIGSILAFYERLGAAYPYDAILLQVAGDNYGPRPELLRNVDIWNQRHPDIEARIATPSEFFGYMEQRYGDQIPAFSGDLTGAWTDDPGIYADASGMKRVACERVVAAEKLAALLDMMGVGDRSYPAEEIAEVYRRLLLYAEHTYGLTEWGWEHTTRIDSQGDLHSPVFDESKASWEAKKDYAYQAYTTSDRLLGDQLEDLAASIQTDRRSILVFNPLSWKRNDVAYLRWRSAPEAFQIVDRRTQEPLPYQVLRENHRSRIVAFPVRDIPPLGYVVYDVVEPSSDTPGDAAAVTGNMAASASVWVGGVPALKVKGNILENRYYRVEVDPITGGVCSILDKEIDRELVDRTEPYTVNQYVHYILDGSHEDMFHRTGVSAPEGRVPLDAYDVAVYTPTSARIERGRSGPLMQSLISEMEIEEGPSPVRITQETILHRDIKRIDLVNRIRKTPTMAKEEVHYCFPFDVENFEITCELPGAVMTPHKDQLPGSFTGFTGMAHWVDASNAQYGVTLFSRDVPAVGFGEIRTNNWATEYTPSKSGFYFYVMNNKENTNGALWQGSETWRMGFLELYFSIRSHAGDWREGASTRFGWECANPLSARVIPAKQKGGLTEPQNGFFEVDRDRVMIQALKKAEDGRGYIVRLYETEGRGGPVRLTGLPMRIRTAYLTDLVERDLSELDVAAGRALEVPIEAFQLVTVRLVP